MSRKVLNIMTWVLFIVSAIIAIFTFASSSALEGGDTGKLNPLFWWTVILCIAAVILALLMPIPGLLGNPKALKKTIFVLLGLVVLFVVVYLLSTGAPTKETMDSLELMGAKRDEFAASSTVANMNIIGVYIMLSLAIIAILWSAFKGLFTK